MTNCGLCKTKLNRKSAVISNTHIAFIMWEHINPYNESHSHSMSVELKEWRTSVWSPSSFPAERFALEVMVYRWYKIFKTLFWFSDNQFSGFLTFRLHNSDSIVDILLKFSEESLLLIDRKNVGFLYLSPVAWNANSLTATDNLIALSFSLYSTKPESHLLERVNLISISTWTLHCFRLHKQKTSMIN